MPRTKTEKESKMLTINYYSYRHAEEVKEAMNNVEKKWRLKYERQKKCHHCDCEISGL